MTIIFDLDYTLFDAKEFKKALAKALGSTVRQYNQDYKEYFKDQGINYNLKDHLKILKERDEGIETQKLIRQADDFFKDIDRFVFPGFEERLKLLRKRNELVLLTFGNIDWQKRKVSNLKIKKYFHRILFVDGEKTKALAGAAKAGGPVLLVNDNAKELKQMRKAIIQAEAYLVKGPYAATESGYKPHSRRQCLAFLKQYE